MKFILMYGQLQKIICSCQVFFFEIELYRMVGNPESFIKVIVHIHASGRQFSNVGYGQ